jgi:hypothetical protein
MDRPERRPLRTASLLANGDPRRGSLGERPGVADHACDVTGDVKHFRETGEPLTEAAWEVACRRCRRCPGTLHAIAGTAAVRGRRRPVNDSTPPMPRIPLHVVHLTLAAQDRRVRPVGPSPRAHSLARSDSPTLLFFVSRTRRSALPAAIVSERY